MGLLVGSERGCHDAGSIVGCCESPGPVARISISGGSETGGALATTRTGAVHFSTEFWYVVDVPSNKPLKRMVGRGRPPTA